LLCSLIHKFGALDTENFDAYIKELESGPSNTVGELFVFVDECHRSESGKMHKVMKAILKNAVFIGFTGTPLLKKDKQMISPEPGKSETYEDKAKKKFIDEPEIFIKGT